MQEKMINNNNSNKNHLFHCLVICQRLFNFIIDSLIPISLKRVTTTSHSMRQGSTAVSILSAAQSNWTKIQHHQALAQITGPSEMVSFNNNNNNNVEKEEQRLPRKRKGKSAMVNNSVLEHEEVKLPSYPPSPPLRQRQVRPLFDVAVNINEKSDAFIRTRKEAMRRNYNFDIETDVF